MDKQIKLDFIRSRFGEVKSNNVKDQEWKNRHYAQLMTELENEFQMNLLDANDNDKDVMELYLEISNSRDFSNY